MEKACPIVLRAGPLGWQVLAFKHPLAGCQFVKGTIEEGEMPKDAALRELREESGLSASIATPLHASNDLPGADAWHFFLCNVDGPLPDIWAFDTKDDGGRRFHFFWHSKHASLSPAWHPLYHQIWAEIVPRLPAH